MAKIEENILLRFESSYFNLLRSSVYLVEVPPSFIVKVKYHLARSNIIRLARVGSRDDSYLLVPWLLKNCRGSSSDRF